MMLTILQVADAFLCVLVVIATAEYLRRIRPMDDPMLSIVLYVITVAAFGSFIFNIKGYPVNLSGMAVNGSIVLYAISRRKQLVPIKTS